LKVPIVWLKDFVDINISADDLVVRLQEAGIPVEGLERPCEICKVVAGKILALDAHPQADKLQVASVDVGGNPLPIVTAATNVRAGDMVPMALEGAVLATGAEIHAVQMRGVLSRGMMCSCEELGLDPRSLPQELREGILILPSDFEPGVNVVDALELNEPVLEVEAFANRPDLLSIIGVAREIAAALGTRMRLPDTSLIEDEQDASDAASIEIEDLDLCPRYIGRIIEDVRVGPSPLWMVIRLLRAGIRSVNNIVDITNYVMVETGQPLHAFDLDLLEEGRVLARPAREGESITTIDSGERQLASRMLVIADGKKPVAVAGVMGGLYSEVSEKTRRVLLESASFHPASVRRTSQALGLRSESSRRFEKGTDWHRVETGSRLAAKLMQQQGAKVLRGSIDVGAPAPDPRILVLRPSRVNRLLGTSLDMEQMERYLASLGFPVSLERTDRSEIAGEPTGNYVVEVPSWRPDISREVDLIEEVARLHGYDRIPVTLTRGETLQGRTHPKDELEEHLRDLFARLGLAEAITYSLHSPVVFSKHGLDAPYIEIRNPLSEEQRAMRLSPLPSLLEVLSRNARNRTRDMACFEITKIYTPAPSFPQERTVVALAARAETPRKADFFALKGILEAFFGELGFTASFDAQRRPGLHPGKCARICCGAYDLGFVGVVHPDVADLWDLSGPVSYSELDVDALAKARVRKHYCPIARHPGVERDLALVLAADIPASSMERIIRNEGKPFLSSARCFDEYRGDQIPEGSRSLAWSLTFQAPDRTLTDDEVEKSVKQIVAALEKQLGAKLRS
jgi:phenylalanyl-tRNA synthetase beta chain